MLWLPGGSFLMGSREFYPEEAPVRRVEVAGFWIDPEPVTNARFARFVEETGYVTVVERPPAGSAVFVPPGGPVPLDRPERWWRFVEGADWRRPLGPGSACAEDHPVVHVALEDALAFAAWAEADLPSEAQWEYAARGGLENAVFAWGDEPYLGGRVMANTWQGRFPWENLALGGFDRTSPVRSFPPNGHGLYDMIGNVWEWTKDRDASGERAALKGGSHLCSPQYCFRARPAARSFKAVDSAASHVGFRLVRSS